MGAITVSAADVIDQLQRSHGNIKHAAGKLGTSRFSLHKYVNERPTVKAALDDIREGAKDDAELMLFDRMRTSDTLLIFYLKTQAHDRGYGDRSKTEITGEGGGPIQTQQVFDHDIVTAAIARRSSGYRSASGANQDDSDGPQVG